MLRIAQTFCILAFASQVHAEDYTTNFLREFHAHPSVVMNRLPDIIEDGKVKSRGAMQYSADKQETRFEVIKASGENPMLGLLNAMSDVTVTGPEAAKQLVYRPTLVENIDALNQSNLMRGQAQFQPWTDSYWPIYKGLIAIRYGDSAFPDSKVWVDNYNYYLANPSSNYLPSRLDDLSPAEKYDLLVGDSSWALTQHMWAEGLERQSQWGSVATWQGICHGWAGASHFRVEPPQHGVTLTSVQGTPIHFYESDITALTSYLWSNSSPKTRFVGSRCRTANPARDEIGRIIDDACRDVDPSTWHLAITNQMGEDSYGFVMDATFDLQVWNFPIAKYRMTYFNPQTFLSTPDLNRALIPIGNFKIDKFMRYRDPNTKFVVGVQMDVSYPGEVAPYRGHHVEGKLKVIRYIYDLELDANRNIIGGEWYSNAHPDFIWTFEKDSYAHSSGDSVIGGPEEWAGQAMPERWAEAARSDSQSGHVLEKIVHKLLDESQKPLGQPF